MYYVYALLSNKNHRIYVGLTKNLKVRIKEHNSGKAKSIKFYRPWILFYYERYDFRLDARAREKKLKSGTGKEFLKRFLLDAPIAQLDRATAF